MAECRRGEVPTGYEQVLYWHLREALNGWRTLLLNLIGVLIWIAVFVAEWMWVNLLRGGDGISAPLLPLPLLLSILAMVVLHEATHGWAMRLYGARPRYGVLTESGVPIAFYATAEGYAFQRTPYLLISLAPLVGLTVLITAILPLVKAQSALTFLAAMAACNVSGSLGDVWIAAIVARYPAQAYVIDERDGMRIFLPQAKSAPSERAAEA